MKKLFSILAVVIISIVLLSGCGTTTESESVEKDSIRTYTEENIHDFIDDDNDQELVRIKGLKVINGKAQYNNSLSSYIVECDNEITLKEGSTVSIKGNVRGYGLDSLDIVLGLSNCVVE